MHSATPVSLAQFDTRIHPCSICSGATFVQLARHDRNLLGVSTVGCSSCGLVQTNPRPSAAGLEVFYRDHYRMYYQGTATPDSQYIESLNKDIRLANSVAFFLDTLKLPHEAAVLDFGCGEGSLFAALRKASFSGAFYGVELNASFGEFASRYGHATVSNTIRAREPVDLVIVNHVLEHLADPIGTLCQLGTLLKPDGRLYIDVPDVEEYTSIQDLHIAHIFHFTVRTLARLVEQAGFHIVLVEKHTPPHHPRSVRLVATRADTLQPPQHATTSPATEQAGWAAARRSGSLGKTLRLRLRQIEPLRHAYLFAKGLVGRRTS
jgi:2-polyprenyl-3-methyl-5-hydroxy-6-metoxy-1,4-benzoquinol methylase